MAVSKRLGLLAVLLVIGACGGGSSSNPAGVGGGAGAGGSSAGAGGTAAPGGAGGTAAPGGAGGTAAPGGAGSGGANSAGGGGSGDAGTGGSSSAGTGGTAGVGGRGGAGGPGTGGRAGAAGGGSGGSAANACTRDLLRGTITAYFNALAAHSPSTLPLAANVKFTENGKVMTPGDGLWRTAGAVKYSQSALDVEICSSATHAVVPEGSMDIPVALRLKVQNQMITEIETIAVRPGDYKLGSTTYASNTGAIIAANSTLMWETPPAAAQRNTRPELTAWMDKYFRMFPRGACNTVSNCRRLENGGG